jgi:hypothetical protein
MEDFKLGDRIKKEFRSESYDFGKIVALPLDKTMVEVQWDNINTINCVPKNSIRPEAECSELEKEFISLIDTHYSIIVDKIREADKLLTEAIELSEKHGMPVPAPILDQEAYIPNSFFTKFAELDLSLVRKLCKVYVSSDTYYGWQNSSSNC